MNIGPPGWSLDMERLEQAITPRTRAFIINFAGQSHRLDCKPRGSSAPFWICPPA